MDVAFVKQEVKALELKPGGIYVVRPTADLPTVVLKELAVRIQEEADRVGCKFIFNAGGLDILQENKPLKDYTDAELFLELERRGFNPTW